MKVSKYSAHIQKQNYRVHEAKHLFLCVREGTIDCEPLSSI